MFLVRALLSLLLDTILCSTASSEGEKYLEHFHLEHNVSMCVCALQSLQLNGKEELKVKDRLPAGLAIHHLHLMSQHMCRELS